MYIFSIKQTKVSDVYTMKYTTLVRDVYTLKQTLVSEVYTIK